jgi:hypothetical protein
MPSNGRPILILGLPRSGTSAVSGALHRLGAFLGGEDRFLPADENNPGGYFEDKALAAFNQRCLAFFQMHPLSLRELPDCWPSYPQSQILLSELQDLLRQFLGHRVWGFKQPLAALVWPIYARVLSDMGLEPQFVLCVRHPAEAHASGLELQYPAGGRQVTPIGNLSGGVWLNYTLGALEAADSSPKTVVPFSSFLREPGLFLRRIVENQEHWEPSDSQWAAALSGVHAENRHHFEESASLESFPEIVGETYRFCESGARDEVAGKALVAEFRAWREMLAPPRLSGTQIGFAWKVGQETKSAVQPFLPTGDWQTVSIRIPAPPRTELHGVLYNQPCRVWVRRCVFSSGTEQTAVQLRPGPGSSLAPLEGIVRLDGAYEPRQIMLNTPPHPGKYTLEMEFLLESGTPIVNDSVARGAQRLQECSARQASLRKGGQP